MGGWLTDNKWGCMAPFHLGTLGAICWPSEKFAVYVEVKKCNFQHAGNQKSVFDHKFYWPINTAFEEADVLDSSFIDF